MRIAIGIDGVFRWLDRFEDVEVFHFTGSTGWRCKSAHSGIEIEVRMTQLVNTFGFIAELKVSGEADKKVEIIWLFGKTGECPDYFWKFCEDKPVRAFENETCISDSLIFGDNGIKLHNADYKYTEISVGLTDKKSTTGTFNAAALDVTEEKAFEAYAAAGAEEVCAMLSSVPDIDRDKVRRSSFVCVWGYSDYNKEEVENAFKRLEYRPFADPEWLEDMKSEWFDHWIGRGLKHDDKFKAILACPERAVGEVEAFWRAQRERLKIETPEPLFDNAAVSTAARSSLRF